MGMFVDNRVSDRFYDALVFAIKAYDGKYDMCGEPYILHPMAVAKSLIDEEEQIVALLHDVYEYTDYTLDDIKNLDFEPDVRAIDCLSRKIDETYEEYIKRICTNKRATYVKVADMKHNLSKIDRLPEDKRALADRYNKWLPVLKERADAFFKGLVKPDKEEDIIAAYIDAKFQIYDGPFYSKRRDPIHEFFLEIKENLSNNVFEKYGKGILDALDEFVARIDKDEMERIIQIRHKEDRDEEVAKLAGEFKKQSNI